MSEKNLITELDGSVVRIDDDDITVELPYLECRIILTRDDFPFDIRYGMPIRLRSTGNGVVIEERPVNPPPPEIVEELNRLIDSLEST